MDALHGTVDTFLDLVDCGEGIRQDTSDSHPHQRELRSNRVIGLACRQPALQTLSQCLSAYDSGNAVSGNLPCMGIGKGLGIGIRCLGIYVPCRVTGGDRAAQVVDLLDSEAPQTYDSEDPSRCALMVTTP